MTDYEKKILFEWYSKLYDDLHKIDSYLKYPNSKMGFAIDKMYDDIADFPFNIDEFFNYDSVGEL